MSGTLPPATPVWPVFGVCGIRLHADCMRPRRAHHKDMSRNSTVVCGLTLEWAAHPPPTSPLYHQRAAVLIRQVYTSCALETGVSPPRRRVCLTSQDNLRPYRVGAVWTLKRPP